MIPWNGSCSRQQRKITIKMIDPFRIFFSPLSSSFPVTPSTEICGSFFSVSVLFFLSFFLSFSLTLSLSLPPFVCSLLGTATVVSSCCSSFSLFLSFPFLVDFFLLCVVARALTFVRSRNEKEKEACLDAGAGDAGQTTETAGDGVGVVVVVSISCDSCICICLFWRRQIILFIYFIFYNDMTAVFSSTIAMYD